MKIVVLDGYTLNAGDLSWDCLEQIGSLKVYDRTAYDLNGKDKIIERIGDAEIVFTNKTPITRDIMEQTENLKYIGVLATGFNVVDIDAAKEKGITVTNIPGYGTAAVAQMTFALLLEICHHVWHHSEEVKKGRWTSREDFCFWDYPLIELSGKTIGIIGFGKIGRGVGQIAQAFGMNVLVNDIYQDKSLENDTLCYVERDTLLLQSDVVSLHCPLLESTKGIINRDTISKMKNGAILINTSRGPLIVEEDLAEALNSGKLSAAAVDVVSQEPIKADNPLLAAKNIIITPHIAWAPVESRKRLMNVAAHNLKRFLAKNPVNVVNP